MSEKYIADRYQIMSRIGEGAWSCVYQAQDTHTGETVALKELREELLSLIPEAVERFRREAAALHRLEHPNIVGIRDAVADNDTHYIVLDYIGGGSLKTLLEAPDDLSLEQSLRLVLQLTDALNAAHSLNIIHRDLKPENILLTATGEVRLTDFGVAHMVDMARVTKTGMPMGTMHYLAPETLRGERVDVRADVWALGVLFFEILCKRHPFHGRRDAETMTAILQHEVPDMIAIRPDCPPTWQALIRQMLMKDREQRTPTMHKVAMKLLALAYEMDIEI